MPTTIKLEKPIAFGEQVIDSLTFRDEVVAGDLRGIKAKNVGPDMLTDDLLKIAGRLCAQPDAVMNKLSAPDFASVGELVAGFLFGGPSTGTTASP